MDEGDCVKLCQIDKMWRTEDQDRPTFHAIRSNEKESQKGSFSEAADQLSFHSALHLRGSALCLCADSKKSMRDRLRNVWRRHWNHSHAPLSLS